MAYLALDRIANVAIDVTREIAGLNHDEAARMWTLWQSKVGTIPCHFDYLYTEADDGSCKPGP